MAQSPLMVRASLSKTPSHWNPATGWQNPLVGLDPRPVKVHPWQPRPGNKTLRGVECEDVTKGLICTQIFDLNLQQESQFSEWDLAWMSNKCVWLRKDTFYIPSEMSPLVIFCCTAPTSGAFWTICDKLLLVFSFFYAIVYFGIGHIILFSFIINIYLRYSWLSFRI